MTDSLFRQLDTEEQDEFRSWARANYTRLGPIQGYWHPIVQDECTKMNAELKLSEVIRKEFP
jgi:hypothetical protein